MKDEHINKAQKNTINKRNNTTPNQIARNLKERMWRGREMEKETKTKEALEEGLEA